MNLNAMNTVSSTLISLTATCLLLFSPRQASAGTDQPAAPADTVETAEPQILRLTDDDYKAVAEELGVEVAAIKAVVDIEAGRNHQGFFAPGKPLINFDLTMFRQHARRKGINLSRYSKSHSIVFSSPDARKYGSTQSAQQERLKTARSIDDHTAVQGTFWGMFQIGGFNWQLSGAASREEFMEMMSRSEYDQLMLFANYIRNTGLLKYLKNKNWAAFARIYNGPSYAARRYHTRLASAYLKHKKAEKAK